MSSREIAALLAAPDWLNSAPLTPADLDGKITVVSFWTYTCINWIRTLPSLRAWAEVFSPDDVVIIGAHTPEFSFEAEPANIRRESTALGVEYPIVIDSSYAIWEAFDNHYWPALYFIDAKGEIRHRHFGESDYERSETVLRQLVREAHGSEAPPAQVEYRGVELPADWDNVRSPETYLGSARLANLVAPEDDLRLNQWRLTGDWMLAPERATLRGGHGAITYQFHARDVNLVMGTGARGPAVPFRVLLDGRPPGDSHGLDTDADGEGVVMDDRMYQLVRLDGPGAEHTLEIEFAEPGVSGYVFTFG